MFGTQKEIDKADSIRQKLVEHHKPNGDLGSLYIKFLDYRSAGDANWWITHQEVLRDLTPVTDPSFLLWFEASSGNRSLKDYVGGRLADQLLKIEKRREDLVARAQALSILGKRLNSFQEELEHFASCWRASR
jgi:hypothetical protein